MARVEQREKLLNRLLITCACDCSQSDHRVTILCDGTQFHSGPCRRCPCDGFRGMIDSFTHEMGYKACEAEARWLKGRLVMGALAISDKKRMERHRGFAWVIWRKQSAPLLKYLSHRYRESSDREIATLKARGVTILSGARRFNAEDSQRGKWESVEQQGVEAAQDSPEGLSEWIRVLLAEAQRLRNEPGWMVRIPAFPEGTPEGEQWGEVLDVS